MIDLLECAALAWSTSQRHQSPWEKTTVMSWIF
jgi:hypothetical protein